MQWHVQLEENIIEVLGAVGYGDRPETHPDSCDDFNDNYPLKQISRSL